MSDNSRVAQIAGQPNKEIREMVKIMVRNLQELQKNIHQILGDLKELVDQIDNVTAKIDVVCGPGWNDDALSKEKCLKTETSENRNTPHLNSNIITSYALKHKPTNLFSNQLHVDEIRPYDASPDLDLSYLHITHGEERSRWGHSLISDNIRPITSNNNLDAIRNLIDNQETDIWNSESTEHSSPINPKPIVRCYAQIKRDTDISPLESVDNSAALDTLENILGADKLDICSSGSDIGYIPGDTVSPEVEDLMSDLVLSGVPVDMFNSKIVNVDSDSDHECGEYDGIYEHLMETQLENLSSSDLSELTETSDRNMELGSWDDQSDTEYSDDIEVRYDRDINTWTSYTLAHMNSSLRSSDSYLSDTPSDILNDNTRATIKYGNMIFSDQLVLLNRKKVSRDRNKNETEQLNAV